MNAEKILNRKDRQKPNASSDQSRANDSNKFKVILESVKKYGTFFVLIAFALIVTFSVKTISGIDVIINPKYWAIGLLFGLVFTISWLEGTSSYTPVKTTLKWIGVLTIIILILEAFFGIDINVRKAGEKYKSWRDESAQISQAKTQPATWKEVYRKTFTGVGYTGGDFPKYNDGGIKTLEGGKDYNPGQRFTVIDSDFELWINKSWKKYSKGDWIYATKAKPGSFQTFRNETGKKFTIIVQSR